MLRLQGRPIYSRAAGADVCTVCSSLAAIWRQKFILEQRAQMRDRLVQAALNGELKWGGAHLAGFAPAQPQILDDSDDSDEEM